MFLFALLPTFRLVLASRALLNAAMESAQVQEYEEFRQRHGRASESNHADEVSYEQRFELFVAQKAAIKAHNSQEGALWRAGLNQFADYTSDEFQQLLGHRPSRLFRSSSSSNNGGSSFLETTSREIVVADSMDWRAHLNVSNKIKNQGACGSCWAVAAVGALETHAEIGKIGSQALSYEQIVDCTPNPQQCGGKGGCRGATAELAFEYVSKNGVIAAPDYKGYQSGGGSGTCHSAQPQSAMLRIGGYTRLPENKLQPLLQAVSNKGPVVVSVDASGWSMYADGVYDSCKRDATVNHAVLLVGYGKEAKASSSRHEVKYWLIRNSWGDSWGQNGYIKLLRQDSDQGEAGFCGTDHNPQEGVGCKGGPSQIPVCGMCGILSDSSYPIGVQATSVAAA